MALNRVGQSVLLFLLAGLCEIGGGWLVWQWMRAGKGLSWGFVGGAILILYGIVPTFQLAHLGRAYAAYGGFFIGFSLLWGSIVDPRSIARLSDK